MPKAKNQHDVSLVTTVTKREAEYVNGKNQGLQLVADLDSKPEEAIYPWVKRKQAKSGPKANSSTAVEETKAQRIGEILRELPTKQGRRSDLTSSDTTDKVTRKRAIEESGTERSQAYDLQGKRTDTTLSIALEEVPQHRKI